MLVLIQTALHLLESEGIIHELGSVVQGGLQVCWDELVEGEHLLHILYERACLSLEIPTPALPFKKPSCQFIGILARHWMRLCASMRWTVWRRVSARAPRLAPRPAHWGCAGQGRP